MSGVIQGGKKLVLSIVSARFPESSNDTMDNMSGKKSTKIFSCPRKFFLVRGLQQHPMENTTPSRALRTRISTWELGKG